MLRRFLNGLVILLLSTFCLTAMGQSPSRETLLIQLEAKRTELQKLEEQILAPSDEDRAAFAEFLKQPDTGLVRLLPREVYDQNPAQPAKLTIRGGGAYYSFTRLTHEYGFGSDLELATNHFLVGFAGADYGLMTTIGDVPLDQISPENAAFTFMANYQPPGDAPSAIQEATSFRVKARTIDGVMYQSRLAVQLNTTYLLRSINYGKSDVLVAFRPVRKDTDGSVVIAWRMLKVYSAPKLARGN